MCSVHFEVIIVVKFADLLSSLFADAVKLPRTCKHTSMCRISGVTL